MIILPKAQWTSQPKYPPRINWAHPATAQLVRAGAATSKRDLVTNAPLTTALIEPGTGGNLISRVGTTWAFSYAAGDEWTVPTNGSLTILAAVPKTRTTTWGGIWRAGALSTGGTLFNVATASGFAQIRITGTDVITPTVGPQVPQGEQVYIAFRSSSGTGAEAAVFWNGEQKRTAAHTRTLSGATINNVGGQFALTDGLGDLAAYWVWNRRLSDSELVALTQNPWQLYQPQRFIFPLQSTAANAYSLDTTPGTYNITGSSPSLLASRLVDTTPGAYDLTGSSPSLLLGRALDTTPGDYDITGSSPSLLLGRALDTTPGDYDITGSPVDLEKATAGQFVLQTTPGAYNITGLPVELIANIAVIGGGGPGKTAKRRGWANERARFEESLRTEEVAEQVKAAQRVLKKAQSESAQRLGELVTEYEAARASLDELREQVARIERESRIREEVEVASKVVEIFAREEEEIIAILEIIDEMDSRALLAAVGIAA
jgi:hypothetical protein